MGSITKKKEATLTFRLARDLADDFSRLCSILPMKKTSFLCACISKLCSDNELQLEFHNKLDKHIDFLRKRLSEVPSSILEIVNGTWENATDEAIVSLCDSLWSYSKTAWNYWFEEFGDYDLSDAEGEEIQKFEGKPLLSLEDIGILFAQRKVEIDPDVILSDPLWSDITEDKRISLIVATRKAVEKEGAKKLIADAVASWEEKTGEKIRCVLDAEGTFKRSGDKLVSPVHFETVEEE